MGNLCSKGAAAPVSDSTILLSSSGSSSRQTPLSLVRTSPAHPARHPSRDDRVLGNTAARYAPPSKDTWLVSITRTQIGGALQGLRQVSVQQAGMHLCSSYQQPRPAAGSVTSNSKQRSTHLASIAACAAASCHMQIPHSSQHTRHHLAPACCLVHPCRRSPYSCCRHNSHSQLCHHSSDSSPFGHFQQSRLHMCCSVLEPMAAIS